MQIPVLIERVSGNGYRARSAEPLGLLGEGATREQAIAKLREQCEAKLQQGAELIAMELGPQVHPLAEFAGMFKDDPDFEDVLQIMADNRKKMDEDPDVP